MEQKTEQKKMRWVREYKDIRGNPIKEEMFGDFPSSWKKRPCPICCEEMLSEKMLGEKILSEGTQIDLEKEKWIECLHGYEINIPKNNN